MLSADTSGSAHLKGDSTGIGTSTVGSVLGGGLESTDEALRRGFRNRNPRPSCSVGSRLCSVRENHQFELSELVEAFKLACFNSAGLQISFTP